MSKLIILSLLLLSLSSCSVFKHHQKQKLEQNTERKEKKDIEQHTTTETISTTTREIDTTIKLPADSVKTTLALPDSSALDTVVHNSDSSMHLNIKYNPKTKKLQVNAKQDERLVPVHAKEQTTTQIKQQIDFKDKSKIKEEQHVKQKDIVIEKKEKRLPMWLGIVFIVAILWIVYQVAYGGKWWIALIKRFRKKSDPGKG